MTFTFMYPAIALATVINAFALAAAWKATLIEKQTGEAPLWFILGALAYIGILGWYFYSTRSQPINTYAGVFMAAMGGQAMGAVFSWLAFQVVSPDPATDKKQRIVMRVYAAGFSLLLLSPFFIG